MLVLERERERLHKKRHQGAIDTVPPLMTHMCNHTAWIIIHGRGTMRRSYYFGEEHPPFAR
jgi:hypothetical protein